MAFRLAIFGNFTVFLRICFYFFAREHVHSGSSFNQKYKKETKQKPAEN